MDILPLVLILAGGEGRKFVPFITNKTIFPFLGKPLMEHLLHILQKSGFSKIFISANKYNYQWLQNFSFSSLEIKVKVQAEPLGMADAILNFEKELVNRPVIIMNAVDLVDPSFFVDFLKSVPKTYALIAGKQVKSYFLGGYLKIKHDLVSTIVEKPQKGHEPSNLVNLVFHYFSCPQDLFSLLHQTKIQSDDAYEQALIKLVQMHPVKYFCYEGSWQKLKYGHDVLAMMTFFLSRINRHIAQTARISQQAVIEGNVFIDEDAKVLEGAVIKGPAYIGKKALIGTHTLIIGSNIENEAVIGMGSEITRSYIGPRCSLHHNFIGDSVLEAEVNPSYGSCTANWRLDKQEVVVDYGVGKVNSERKKLGALVGCGTFLGVGTKLMPGAVVGSYTKSYPGAVISGFVQPNNFCNRQFILLFFLKMRGSLVLKDYLRICFRF